MCILIFLTTVSNHDAFDKKTGEVQGELFGEVVGEVSFNAVGELTGELKGDPEVGMVTGVVGEVADTVVDNVEGIKVNQQMMCHLVQIDEKRMLMRYPVHLGAE